MNSHCLRQIHALNQRGGRTLSIVDVMRAGTISSEAAGFLLWRVAQGSSFVTGAVPGGVGKSTLLADLLGMLPPGECLVTTPDDEAVRRALRDSPRTGRCYLCHEIGAGHWYAYLWGPTVGRFFRLMEDGGRVAACLHADDPLQMRGMLLSPTLGVSDAQFARIGLLLFMAFEQTAQGASRAVDSIWSADGQRPHRKAYGWDRRAGRLQESDWVQEFVEQGTPTLAACQAFMAELAGGSASRFEDVRERIEAFYRG